MSATNKTWSNGSAPQCEDADLNGFKNENNNFISNSGLSLNTGNNQQTSQSATIHVAGADFYTDSGTGSAYVLTINASTISPQPVDDYFNGLYSRFRPANANTTTAPTYNISAIGGKVIVLQDGSALAIGDMNTTVDAEIRYDTALGKGMLLNPQISQPVNLPTGYLSGVKLEAAADVDHDITFNTGQCRDDANTFSILFTSALTKQLDAPWAAGDNAGGLASGTIAINTTYHCFLISKTDGTTDAIFDISETGANIAAAAPTYTKTRRVGSRYTDASANLVEVDQDGDDCTLVTVDRQSINNPATASTLRTIAVPTGVNVTSLVGVILSVTGGAAANAGWLFAPSVNSPPLVDAIAYGNFGDSSSNGTSGWSELLVKTNTSAQIRSTLLNTSVNVDLIITTMGWKDTRGRL